MPWWLTGAVQGNRRRSERAFGAGCIGLVITPGTTGAAASGVGRTAL